MTISIDPVQRSRHAAWDRYVEKHPQGSVYHLSAWGRIIEKTYGHGTYYLAATRNRGPAGTGIVGVLPLVHLKHFLFGNNLTSIPFFDMGGVLADDPEIENALIAEAGKIGRRLNAGAVELRQMNKLACLERGDAVPGEGAPLNCSVASDKVGMVLTLPESSDALMKSFKAKLRSQIRRPLKGGLDVKIGGRELLDDFYRVFSINMRELGSPVHAKGLMGNVVKELSGKARIFIVHGDGTPAACGLVAGFGDTLGNPWASALREYSRLSPNMLLYWAMLEYACDNGYRYFDFGRSSPGEGTYRFKKQWGAVPRPLYWHRISLNGDSTGDNPMNKSKYSRAIAYWRRLPVPVTRLIGPWIRRYIDL